jgi:hypothetical protein
LGVEAIYTAAYQTLIAQQATVIALTPPTSTVTPTAPPTLPPLPLPAGTTAFTTATLPVIGGGGSACDNAAFVKDVTIPDNTVLDPGKKFTKTWTLLNNGTCTWGSGYSLAFQSGDQMGGATAPIGASVGPGSSLNISVQLTAPTSNGTYKGVWRMENASNQAFGDTPWVIIKVGAGTSATAVATGTACSTSCTITVTMNVATGNVVLDFSSATSTPTVTPISGGFTFSVSSGWSGTITPVKGNGKTYVFDPESVRITNVTTNQTVSFTASSVTPVPTDTPTPHP